MNPFRSQPRALANPARTRLLTIAWLVFWIALGAIFSYQGASGFSWRLFLLTVFVAGVLPLAVVAYLGRVARRGGAP